MFELKRIDEAPVGRASERGAQFVELALVLPVFLMLVFMVIDMSRIGLAYSAVRTATYEGTRQVTGFQRKEWSTVSALFSGPADQQIPAAQLSATLTTVPEFLSDPVNGKSTWYQCMAAGGSTCNYANENRTPLTGLYRVEARAIAVANLVLAENIGGLNYPCDARFGGGAGCARCFTLRGDNDDYDNWFHYQGTTWLTKSLALECEVDVPVITASFFFGLMPRSFRISSKFYATVDHLPDGQFLPDP